MKMGEILYIRLLAKLIKKYKSYFKVVMKMVWSSYENN